jgi:hypothetical protein
MAGKLTIPDPTAAFARCPHCGAEVKITEYWYTALQRLLAALNALIP